MREDEASCGLVAKPDSVRGSGSMARVVVTGGSGFLGRHLIDALLAQAPDTTIVVFDLRVYEHHADSTPRIEVVTGSVTELGDVVSACRGADTVYHCVSADPLDSTNERLMWAVNVAGTRNVVEACKQCAVARLVYVSSASVVFDGTPIVDADETLPYPTKYQDFYSMTKARAEAVVLAANRGALATCALRPSSIFGERDPVFVPRLVEAGKTGKTKYIIGDGLTRWEFTYVGNIAQACIQAAEKLTPGSPVAGQAYFITNDEPTLFWRQCGVILGSLGYPEPSVCIPFSLCSAIAILIEFCLLLLSPVYKPSRPPTFSRARVLLLTTHRTMSCAKAKRDFGYSPSVSMEEGTRRTIDYFLPLAADAEPAFLPATKVLEEKKEE